MRVEAVGLHLLHYIGNRRAAVAHRVSHLDLALPFRHHPAAQQLGLPFGVHAQRRALVGPHGGVLLGRLLRPDVEDDAVQDQPPQRLRHLDHAVVGQEFLQVAAQRRRIGLVRRAQIDQQHAGTRHPAV